MAVFVAPCSVELYVDGFAYGVLVEVGVDVHAINHEVAVEDEHPHRNQKTEKYKNRKFNKPTTPIKTPT